MNKSKSFYAMVFGLALAPLLAACAPYDYSDRVSEIRSDLFLAETQDYLREVTARYASPDFYEWCIVLKETGSVKVEIVDNVFCRFSCSTFPLLVWLQG